ncbi:Phytanoyl-CoA dioxygenase (PhyH) [Mariniblastus fucicola]|uniref:Phytanoyl-CoA dioxygenase (PhyH) n=1 Tax=Mariniblastus fucicola TaxID=980251 RepID=A0A5B9PDP6_9BACT|nr:Phytanoyl-CoA dioxygenase (PhyH) [Mariniblastus fucicola]
METKTQIQTQGFCIVQNVFGQAAVEQLLHRIEMATRTDAESALSSRGTIFAARNLIDSIPDLLELIKRPALATLLSETIGENYGLVRVLYFDKPSDRSWNLPFHKDLTIAVQDNSLPTNHFSKPTHKAGVDHVEASEAILQNMLTLRIHLDEVTESNGPLEVIPGSHLSGKQYDPSPNESVKILVQAGDVLAMRPMISHASGHTDPDGKWRRRILHLEFCGTESLPDGYQWMHFLKRRAT